MGTVRGSQSMRGTGQLEECCLDKGVKRYNIVLSAANETASMLRCTPPFAIMAKVRMMKRLVRLTVERLLVDRMVRGFRRYLHT